jgi:hypothetical protein
MTPALLFFCLVFLAPVNNSQLVIFKPCRLTISLDLALFLVFLGVFGRSVFLFFNRTTSGETLPRGASLTLLDFLQFGFLPETDDRQHPVCRCSLHCSLSSQWSID